MADEVEKGNWVYRGADVSRGGAMVPRYVRNGEIERAWRADYRIHAGAAITGDAGRNLAKVRKQFNALNQEDPNIGGGLGYFESNYIAGAGDIIADYMDGDK